MSSRLLELCWRHIGRLRSNRSVFVGFTLWFLLIGLLVLSVYVASTVRSAEPSSVEIELRERIWESEGLLGMLSLVFAIVLGASMVNDDIKSGTIVGVLARPVSRGEYFVCSWLGAAAFLLALELLRCGVTVGSAVILEGHLSALVGLGMVAAFAGDLLLLATFSAIGAGWSTGTTVLAGLSALVVEALAFAPRVPAWLAYPLNVLGVVLPLPRYQNDTISRALMGESRELLPVVEIIAYRFCWTLALIAVGVFVFRRRDVVSRVQA